MRNYYEAVQKAFGPNVYNDFMLAHGRDYAIGPDTYAGPRHKAQECYANATHLACFDDSLTYVEGKIAVYGVPIDHAWCVDRDGFVVDPTLGAGPEGDTSRITGYFGVPFRTDYLRRAVMVNKVYGLLDYFHAAKTAPKLFELGLEAGQQWLFDNPVPRKTRRKKLASPS